MFYRITLSLFMLGLGQQAHACSYASSVDSAVQHIVQLPSHYLSQVSHQSSRIAAKVSRRSRRALNRFSLQEERMQAKLWKVDSLAAKNIFAGPLTRLNSLKSSLKNKTPQLSGRNTSLELDTLQNTLKFLEGSDGLIGGSKAKLGEATRHVKDLQNELQQASDIKAFISQQQKLLKTQLGPYGNFSNDLKKLSKEAYYYNEQVKEYKSLLKERRRAEEKALEQLKKLQAYNDFLRQHSQLAGLFDRSAATANPQNLEGLQTRSQVDALLQQRLGSDPNSLQAFNQQMSEARSQLNELKEKFPDLDNAAEMPDFKPNPMKTKSFIQRLEFGGNIQFQKNNKYFPATADIAAQVGYKFHKDGTIGLGLSYKLGLGKGWNAIAISHQGVGLRTFADWKLKGTFFVNGGFEGNYLAAFSHLDPLKSWNGWQKSALLGISKKYKINAKLQGNIMLLYDFLSHQSIPQSSPMKLRMGYTF
jgi:hypothetical protein